MHREVHYLNVLLNVHHSTSTKNNPIKYLSFLKEKCLFRINELLQRGLVVTKIAVEDRFRNPCYTEKNSVSFFSFSRSQQIDKSLSFAL